MGRTANSSAARQTLLSLTDYVHVYGVGVSYGAGS